MRLVFMRLVHGACVAIASQRKGDKSSIMKLVHGWKHTVANLDFLLHYSELFGLFLRKQL